MIKTRNNHYVPQWYQKGFHSIDSNKLFYLDLEPESNELPDGRIVKMNDCWLFPTSKCFVQKDLYTTFFGQDINDEIERKLFGKIDDTGVQAIKAFIGDNKSEWHYNISNFFEYIDAQKIRTPKGLSWIKNHYPDLNQTELMEEMQAIRQSHITILSEGVREIVSAKNSNVKFLLSDNPVTIYNYDCPPDDEICNHPNDPSISFVCTQTIFPLNMDNCLIVTNYEYAEKTDISNPRKKRTHARNFGTTIIKTDALIKERELNEEDVKKINYIIKKRAHKYIAASKKEWLYPEKDINISWVELRNVLLPPKNQLWQWGGEMFIGYKDGSTHYQDAFGRITPENKLLRKPNKTKKIGKNDYCGCGSGRKYKKCCIDIKEEERSSWEVLSIRERNLAFANGVINILGLSKDKIWDDVRKDLSNEQVKEIHELYGFFWPIDTDIIKLLPKSSNQLRAVYTGIIDVRVISKFAVGATLYFDEIIIHNPFTNPHFVKSELSPIDNPHQYKQQTLNNVLLLLRLLPFIESGYINLIPDILSFNQHALKQMLSMARKRTADLISSKKDYKIIEWLRKDDFERMNSQLPEAQREIQIRQVIPDISDIQIKKILKFQNKKKLQDPLTLLQDDVYGKYGGQLQMLHLSPNFEALLFISQITHSIILTDSNYRWDEINSSLNLKNNDSLWNDLETCIKSFEYYLDNNQENIFNLRNTGKLAPLRNIMKKIYLTIKNDNKISSHKVIEEKLKLEYIKAYKSAMKEIPDSSEYSFNVKFKCLIPNGGIAHKNVQRMLLSSGIEKFLNNVPMAIFIEKL